MKSKHMLLSILLFITACSVQGDYLPMKSEYYEIKNKTIFYQNSDLTIHASGKCSRPDLYNLVSIFKIVIKTKNDSLNVNFRDINFVANGYKSFKRYNVNGPNGESEFYYNLIPNQEYTFDIEGVLFDSLLVEFNDNLNEVNLIMNGISNSDNILNIPLFLFKTDSTIFNIKE